MKKFLFQFVAIFMLPMAANAQFDFSGILNAIGNAKSDSTKGDTGSMIGGIISGFLSNDKLEVKDLVGTWQYKAPAVTFKSDNLLKKAGGEAAASAIEKKLAPYYKTTGLDKMVLTINADSTFSFKLRTITLSGTIEKNVDETSDYNFTMRFTALKNINLAAVDVYVKKSATSDLDLMFDVSKLVEIAQNVSKVAKSSTINAAVSVLNRYEGVCAGFTLPKKK